MKNVTRRIISVILMLALCVCGLYQEPHMAEAAESYEEVAGWRFDSTDTYSNSWSKGGYTSSGITPTYTIENGYLKVEEDYTGATSTTYNRAMAMYSFGASSQADLSEAVKVTFNYYCTSGNTPSQFMFVFTGKLSGASSNTTVSESGAFSGLATKQTTSDIEGYDKYEVTYELTAGDNDANINQRAYVTRMQIGEVRTNNTFKGTVYYDNIVFWKEAVNAPKATLNYELAVFGKNISVSVANLTGTLSYQWYKASSADLSDAQAIEGAVSASYTPVMKQVGGYLYCVVTNGTESITSNVVRIAAAEEHVETKIPFTTTAVSNNQWFLTNTKAYSGKFDADKLLKGGYFLVNYSGNIRGVPSFQFATWSSTTGKSTKQISATATGTNTDGTKWAKYSYEACIAAWGDEDFSELKALRVYYKADDNANLNVESVSWFGAPLSYGELGEKVDMKGSYTSHHYLFTWHVGGTFDATRIKEDSFFYVEYKGDADALNMVCQSHSNTESTYVTIGASETGETGTGYYSIFTAEDIVASFGEELRYVDGMRLVMADGKSITENASMYFFEGTGALVDDISADGYRAAIDVPWTKYDDTDKAGIVVIGASITQNPLVTAAALSGAPYYAPNGGWNAILDRTDVVTYGIGSQTTVNIANRFDEILKYDYHTIIIQCGNNDLGASSDESVVIAQEVNSYTTMFEKVKAENEIRVAEGKEPIQVYVLALNPTNSEGYSNTMQSRIENVIAAIDELSSNYDFVTYIDEIHEEFKNKDQNGNYITGSPNDPDCTEVHVNPDLVMSDGLHPVAEGYAVYAKYLIPLLATDDESDSSLVSLSYRFMTEEMKKVVTGFESATQTGENDYTVLLPLGTADNATIQLYMTAANLSSTVNVEGFEIKTDSYGNNYTEIQLTDGAEDVAVKVTSPDGTVSTYNITFGIDQNTVVYENEDEKEIVVNDGNIDSWPYVQYTVNYSGTLYTGSVLEFDVTLDNDDFTTMYLEADFDWANVKSMNLTKDDFSDNTYHAVITYAGAELSSIGGIQIKTGGSDITDYRGTITISNVKLDNNVPVDDDGDDNSDIEPDNSPSEDDNTDNDVPTGDNTNIADKPAGDNTNEDVLDDEPATGDKGVVMYIFICLSAIIVMCYSFRLRKKDE
ncbi:MAG: hypothetical protein IJZ25_04045 [Lachnospiraceae bacterium]|nr:hypothetical protein [Lachnospiraceae bacterium]